MDKRYNSNTERILSEFKEIEAKFWDRITKEALFGSK